jgi:phenylacetate-CoA ligase
MTLEVKKSAAILKSIRDKKSDFWIRERERQSIKLFQKAAKDVPAYKDFLRKNKIDANKIKTWADFQLVPPINKENYLKQYPLEKLCWHGSLRAPFVFTSTSGSTGEPFYFPRAAKINWQSSVVHELFFRQNTEALSVPTLVLVCFGMGVWIGGLITYEAFTMASRRGNLPISILTPGINKEAIFSALSRLAPQFKQVILVGYPPFIKDLLDEAPQRGIKIKNLGLRFVLAAEVFTESFRDHIVRAAGVKNIYRDILHIYGSADIGTMAWETGIATLAKRLSLTDRSLFEETFSSTSKIPTLAQFYPEFVNFEASAGEVLLTGDSAIPLVRYAIGDRGGTLSFDELASGFERRGHDLRREIKKAGISDLANELPFVYIYERSDFSTTIYGLQVFPEMLRDALFEEPAKKYLTGKFTLDTKFDEDHNQYLEINLELRKGVAATENMLPGLPGQIAAHLCRYSSEYNELYKHVEARAIPRLAFWQFEDSRYFKPGGKQQWIKKQKI